METEDSQRCKQISKHVQIDLEGKIPSQMRTLKIIFHSNNNIYKQIHKMIEF